MKQTEINVNAVKDLWARGYTNAQVKMALGIKKSTWDRWYKALKETPVETPETPVETPETPVETPETPVETPDSVGRGGVRYKYTDQAKYEEFRKDDVHKAIEAVNNALGKGYGVNQKVSERPVGKLEHSWTFPYDINGNPISQKPYTYVAPARSKRKSRPDNIPEEHWNQYDILPEEWMPLCQSWKEFLDCYDVPSYKDFAEKHGISKKQVRKVTRQFNAANLF